MTDDHARRAGTVTIHGGEATLLFERRLKHSVEEVWAAITEPAHLQRWYMTQAVIDGRVGGTIDFHSGPARVHATGRILAWDPPRLFEHERNIEASPTFPTGDRTIVRWELAPDGDATILRLLHRRVPAPLVLGVAPATHALLDRLEAELDHASLPDLGRRMGEVRAYYPKSL